MQGRTWGYTRNSTWVDRGCRADFEVGRGRGNGNYGNCNADAGAGGYGAGNRPNGRVSYSDPKNKALLERAQKNSRHVLTTFLSEIVQC